jgi:type IV pilus assembly protein PilA
MHTHRRAPSLPRGFTLVELLITVAIISLLAALALAGYLRYFHSAQSAEARAVFGQIRAGEEGYRVEELQYLSCSSAIGAGSYYPNATPNDTKWSWQRSTDPRYTSATSGWQMLNVNPDGPVRYGYAVMAGIAPAALPAVDGDWLTDVPTMSGTLTTGTPWFAIAARNVHVPGGPPTLLFTTSYDNTIMSYNDGN